MRRGVISFFGTMAHPYYEEGGAGGGVQNYPPEMPFHNATKSLAKLLDPQEELLPVCSIIDQDHYRPLCLLHEKKKRHWLWKNSRFQKTEYRLTDVLLSGGHAAKLDNRDPVTIVDQVDGTLEGDIGGLNTSMEIKGITSVSRVRTAKVQKIKVPPTFLDAMTKEALTETGDELGTSQTIAGKQTSKPWFKKKHHKHSRGPETLGSSPIENENPGSPEILTETGDELGTSQTIAGKQTSEPWLKKQMGKFFSCWKRPKSSAATRFPDTGDVCADDMGTSQGSVAPPPSVSGSEPLEDLPAATGVREQDSAKDVCGDMATSQGSVAPPPSVSGSEPLGDLPTATGNRGQHNANENHYQSLHRSQTESSKMGTFNPKAPVLFQDLDSDEMEEMYYPSFCSESTQDECLLFPSDGCPLSSHEMKSHLHRLSKLSCLKPLKSFKIADIIAENYLDIFIQLLLEEDERECEITFLAVLNSKKCNVDKLVHLLICTARGGPCSFPVPEGEESERKMKAIKLLVLMVRHMEQPKRLEEWILDFFIIFSTILTKKVIPGVPCYTSAWALREASDMIKIINKRWNVLNSMFLKHCAFH